MQDLISEIEKIKERNIKVERDKKWEISLTRKISIAILTYLIAVLWLYFIDETSIFLKSVIPTGGYILSTLSIPIIRKIWSRYAFKN